ncbi:MAG: DUF4254 domain-containing protein [Desulfovibrio sp.]|nr:MAG: DUF4254 domain-containing protein [Desulfovibrio sp.]
MWCQAAQLRAVRDWHDNEPTSGPDPSPDKMEQGAEPFVLFQDLVLAQHLVNFQLWHVEDRARRRDVGPEVIAQCKQEIDALNQRRNDMIERMDDSLIQLMSPLLPESEAGYNTETLGSVLDRLSILALKIYHMREQAERQDAPQEQIEECAAKLTVMQEQHRDLVESMLGLVREYGSGLKRPKVYRQYKMYNDPRLNPELYGGKA